MNNNLISWMHDDITWCMDHSCPVTDCMRNPKNMMNPVGVHSYADFRQCDECVIFRAEQNAKEGEPE